MKILVVDHEKVNLANLADKLIAHGHQATSVGDGQEALDRLHDESFDLVFADAKTPKIDGVELLRRIKQGSRTETPVILMSSNGSIPVAVQAVKLGAYDFIKKPIPTEKLRTLLTDIDRQRGQHHADSPALRGRESRRHRPGDHRRVIRHRPGETDDSDRLASRCQRLDPRRDRGWQGSRGVSDPPAVPPLQSALHQSGVHAAAAVPDRK